MRIGWVLTVLGAALFAASCGGESKRAGGSGHGGGTESTGGSGGMGGEPTTGGSGGIGIGGEPATGGSAGFAGQSGTSGSSSDYACTGTTSCERLDDSQCFAAVNDDCQYQHCIGTPLPCASAINCRAQGCARNASGECTGTPLPCFMFSQTTYCVAQEGCSQTMGPCSGNQTLDCDFFPRTHRSAEECMAQPNCTFHPHGSNDWTCTGTPLACSEFVPSTCDEIVGCAVPPSTAPCTGEPLSCSEIGVEGTCGAQSGCEWNGEACVGTHVPCANFDNDQVGCFGQIGCTYPLNLPCSGIPAACETLVATNGFGPDDCRTQYACRVE